MDDILIFPGFALGRPLCMNRPLTPSLSPSDGERVAEGRVRGGFMVPMHAKNERRLSMNGGARLRRALIFDDWLVWARRSLAPPGS